MVMLWASSGGVTGSVVKFFIGSFGAHARRLVFITVSRVCSRFTKNAISILLWGT